MEKRGSEYQQTSQIKEDLFVGSKSTIPQTKLDELSREHFSYLRLLYFIVISIFLAEVVAMIVVYELPDLPYIYVTLIDAGIMTVLIFPMLYLLSFRPLLRHIEKRRQAEEQVREVALFATFNPDAVLRVDATGLIKMSNPAAQALGLCVGAQLTEVIPDLQNLDLAGCITAGITRHVQETYLGEHIFQWTIRGVPEQGLAFLYCTDITLRKQAEDLNRQLSRIVEQTEDSVVVTNQDGVIEYVNPAFERLTGHTYEEAIGKTPRLIKSGVHDHEFYQNMWDTILRGDVFQSEIANCKKNGELFYEVKTIAPLRDAQGNITHFVATGKDITVHKQDEERLRKAFDELELRVWTRTEELRIANSELEKEISERKQAEEAVRRSEVMLRAVLEQMPSGVTVRDARTGKLVLSNVRSLEILHGLVEIPEQFAEYRGFHPDGRPYRNEEWPAYRSMTTGEVVNAEEIECERGDGSRFTLLVSAAPIYDIEGKIVNAVAVFHDITERKRAEAALRFANEELTRFNRVMVGRELRMIELKKEVNELCKSASQLARYSLDFEKE